MRLKNPQKQSASLRKTALRGEDSDLPLQAASRHLASLHRGAKPQRDGGFVKNQRERAEVPRPLLPCATLRVTSAAVSRNIRIRGRRRVRRLSRIAGAALTRLNGPAALILIRRFMRPGLSLAAADLRARFNRPSGPFFTPGARRYELMEEPPLDYTCRSRAGIMQASCVPFAGCWPTVLAARRWMLSGNASAARL